MNRKQTIKEILLYGMIGLLSLYLLYPILVVGMHNYPSGDDYWFGIYTYQGFLHNGIIGAFKGSLKMIGEIYETWQGTWFTLFLFTLSPHNFNAHSYFLTVYISLICLGIAYFIILKRYLYYEYGFSRITLICAFFMIYHLSIQYIPRTTSGIFWFNGIMHYTIPFLIAMGCISSSRLILNCDNTKLLFTKIMLLSGMIALGGSNYLAAIIGMAGIMYEMLQKILIERQEKKLAIKKYIIFISAIVLEFVGLYVSYKSPGNNIRANDDMSFRPMYFIKCIWWSIDRSRIELVKMFSERPVLWLYLCVTIILIALELISRRKILNKNKRLIKYPIMSLIFVNGVHVASYLPEVYAASDVSGGVPNTHYWMLLIVILADIIILEDTLFYIINTRTRNANNTTRFEGIPNVVYYIVPLLLVLFVVCYIAFGSQKTTNDYCKEYISSGKMYEYEKIWWEAYAIFIDTGIDDAIVPDYHEDIYPVCHMTLSEDSGVGHNVNRARYYDKKTVTAYVDND